MRQSPFTFFCLFLFLLLSLFLFASSTLAAQTSLPELRVCSQNLSRFGERSRKGARYKDKKIVDSLIERVSEAKCDVIALQEVYGKTQREAQGTLKNLREALQKETGTEYLQFVGASNDPYIRNGFFLALGSAEVVAFKSFANYNLPLLRKYGSNHKFSRGPLLLHLRVSKKERTRRRELLVLNLHFKSKYNSWKDPAKIQYEDLRMEMAEAVREIAFGALAQSAKDAILLIVGDRNSSVDAASAQILYGTYQLNDFSHQGVCALDKKLRANCKKGFKERKQALRSLFSPNGKVLFPQYASYQYQKHYYLYDDIVTRSKDRRYFLGEGKKLMAGLIGRFGKGEELDHRMAWAEVNF